MKYQHREQAESASRGRSVKAFGTKLMVKHLSWWDTLDPPVGQQQEAFT